MNELAGNVKEFKDVSGLYLGCKGNGDHYACIHDIPVSPANAVKWCSPGDNNALLLKYF